MTEMHGRHALAAQIWQQLFGFFMHTRPRRDAVLARLGLTPNDAKALYSLDSERGRTMTALARMWGCDASTATWTVDRLERLGLAERRPHPTDRRVRLVLLTEQGAATQAELLAGMLATPDELLQLSDEQLQSLHEALKDLPRGLFEFPEY